MRRYVGTFHHRKLGVRGNGMVVWDVREDEIEHLGPVLAQAPEVSHCYARNAIPGFPYRLYSMLHGPSEEACRDIAARISGQLGVSDYLILFSSREFKKCRLRYFLPELDAWWAERGPGPVH
jgi:DNA-binding Lrp family transcriptional regulator